MTNPKPPENKTNIEQDRESLYRKAGEAVQENEKKNAHNGFISFIAFIIAFAIFNWDSLSSAFTPAHERAIKPGHMAYLQAAYNDDAQLEADLAEFDRLYDRSKDQAAIYLIDVVETRANAALVTAIKNAPPDAIDKALEASRQMILNIRKTMPTLCRSISNDMTSEQIYDLAMSVNKEDLTALQIPDSVNMHLLQRAAESPTPLPKDISAQEAATAARGAGIIHIQQQGYEHDLERINQGTAMDEVYCDMRLMILDGYKAAENHLQPVIKKGWLLNDWGAL